MINQPDKDAVLKIMNRKSVNSMEQVKRKSDVNSSEIDSERVQFQVNCPIQIFNDNHSHDSSHKASDHVYIQESDSLIKHQQQLNLAANHQTFTLQKQLPPPASRAPNFEIIDRLKKQLTFQVDKGEEAAE